VKHDFSRRHLGYPFANTRFLILQKSKSAKIVFIFRQHSFLTRLRFEVYRAYSKRSYKLTVMMTLFNYNVAYALPIPAHTRQKTVRKCG